MDNNKETEKIALLSIVPQKAINPNPTTVLWIFKFLNSLSTKEIKIKTKI